MVSCCAEPNIFKCLQIYLANYIRVTRAQSMVLKNALLNTLVYLYWCVSVLAGDFSKRYQGRSQPLMRWGKVAGLGLIITV